MPDETGIQSLKTIAKGAGIVFTGIFISKILSLLFSVFTARYFGPGDYGLFSLGVAVVGFFTSISVMGLYTGVIRFVAHYRAKGDERHVRGVIVSSLGMAVPVSLLMASLMALSSNYLAVNVFNEPHLGGVILIMSVSVPFAVVLQILLGTFLGFKVVKYRVYTEYIFTNIAKVLFVVLFWMIGLGVLGIAWAWTLASILTVVLAFHYLRKMYPIFRNSIKSVG